MHDMAIYTVPIFRPIAEEVALADIPARVNFFLSRYKTDGFVQWNIEETRVALLPLFAKKGWWNITSK
jgi:hypothetical protein